MTTPRSFRNHPSSPRPQNKTKVVDFENVYVNNFGLYAYKLYAPGAGTQQIFQHATALAAFEWGKENLPFWAAGQPLLPAASLGGGGEDGPTIADYLERQLVEVSHSARRGRRRGKKVVRSVSTIKAITTQNCNLRALVGAFPIATTTRDQLYLALLPLTEHHGDVSLAAHEYQLYEAFEMGIDEGARTRANPLRRPLDLVSKAPPARGRTRESSIRARALKLLESKSGSFFTSRELADMDKNGLTGRQVHNALHRESWSSGPVMRLFDRARNVYVFGWVEDTDEILETPESFSDDLTDVGNFLTATQVVTLIAMMPVDDHVPALLEGIEACRGGEVFAALIGDYRPGNRETNKRGVLVLHRAAKNETSRRALQLSWEVDRLIQKDLERRYGDQWRSDPKLRHHRLVHRHRSGHRYAFYEALGSEGLLFDPSGTARVVHGLRKAANNAMRVEGGATHHQLCANAGHAYRPEGATSRDTNSEKYQELVAADMTGAAEARDRYIDKLFGGTLDLDTYRGEQRKLYMSPPEAAAWLSETYNIGLGTWTRRGLVRSLPMPAALRTSAAQRVYLRSELDALVRDHIQLPDNAILLQDAAPLLGLTVRQLRYRVNADETRYGLISRRFGTELFTILDRQAIEALVVVEAVPLDVVTTKEAAWILGLTVRQLQYRAKLDPVFYGLIGRSSTNAKTLIFDRSKLPTTTNTTTTTSTRSVAA